MIQGLRTVIYHVTDLARAKEWYTAVLGHGPYFDQPFYVGYAVGGFELGLVPDTRPLAQYFNGRMAAERILDVLEAQGIPEEAFDAIQAEYGGSVTLSTDVTPRNAPSLAARVFTVFPCANFDTSSDTIFACALILIATTTGAAPAGAVLIYASTSASPASNIANPPSCSVAFVLRSAINCLYQFSSDSGS